MAIEFDCRCGRPMRVQDEHAGMMFQCPNCGCRMLAPDQPSSVAPYRPSPLVPQPPMKPGNPNALHPPVKSAGTHSAPHPNPAKPQLYSQPTFQKPTSSGTWIAGLVAVCFLGLPILLVGLVISAGLTVMALSPSNGRSGLKRSFVAQGYEHHSGNRIVESDSINERRVYEYNDLTFNGDINTDIVLLGNSCRINGDVQGDIVVDGNSLVIGPNSVVHGDIDARSANSIRVEGRLDGIVKGRINSLSPSSLRSKANWR